MVRIRRLEDRVESFESVLGNTRHLLEELRCCAMMIGEDYRVQEPGGEALIAARYKPKDTNKPAYLYSTLRRFPRNAVIMGRLLATRIRYFVVAIGAHRQTFAVTGSAIMRFISWHEKASVQLDGDQWQKSRFLRGAAAWDHVIL